MPENIFKTFGCRLNIFETEVIKNFVSENRIENVAVINTCAVTAEAERKAKREIQKLKKENEDVFLIVTGCASQLNPAHFEAFKEVDLVLGNSEKLIGNYWSEISKIKSNTEPANSTAFVSDIMSCTKLPSKNVKPFDTKTRAFIGIQNGCDHRCTFCVIPYARGNSRSLTKIQVKEQIEKLVSLGVKEVVLTGVDITSWGSDLEEDSKLGDLIEFILDQIPELPRLRISSIDSIEVDPKLINLLCQEKRLMPHLHLSLQSGDNMILKRMKRRHSREDVIDFCNNVKNHRAEIAFSADVIAGFPTETPDMFENTVSIIEECQIDRLHVFPFSARPGTPASKMPQISQTIIEERAAHLREISNKKLTQHLKLKIGSHQNVLIEANLKGFTEDFSKVTFPEGPKIGDIVKMRITDQINNGLLGNPIL